MQAVHIIQQRCPGFVPKVGIVLGSGLGDFAHALTESITIPYSDLPGFPKPSVHGHAGQLIAGYVNGVACIALQGRAHAYENPDFTPLKTYVRTLQRLGCEIFIATNAAGSMLEAAGPGSLVLINDHLNLQPGNPLAGPNDDEFGPRFLPLDNAYNPALRERLHFHAKQQNIKLHEGVYAAVLGPVYETAAEIRAFQRLGADVVGMSTVPEVIVAHHCGMKVAVLSIITNYATGLAKTSHDHNEVVVQAARAGKSLQALLTAFIGDFA
jgi:xanthosine phosphorylase